MEDPPEDLQAHWHLGASATKLDTGAAAIELATGERIPADGVVIATGSRARRWPDSQTMAGVHVVRTVDDAVALRAELVPGAHIVVIGAGFVGAEVASTARKMGVDVTIVEAAPTPLHAQLGRRLGAAVAAAHAVNGTRLICGAGVARLTGQCRDLRAGHGADRVTGVDLTDGRHLPADVVVVGIGGTPNIEWLRCSPLALGDGVLCGANGQTAIPNVVAAGDCAAWHDFTTDPTGASSIGRAR
nr:NAD(P)/FAD-dependent oxidoreductase [Mycobacterium stomatepiae]